MADSSATTSATAAVPQVQNGAAGSKEEALLTQVEFYLSDSNLPFDKFLFTLWSDSFNKPEQVILSTPAPAENANPAGLIKHSRSKHDRFHLGWIPLEKLSTFKRMREFTEPAPKGFGSVGGIAKALEPSTLIEAREFGKDGEENAGWYIRRKTELKRPADVLDRSVYVKGFPVSDAAADSDDAKKALRETEHELQQQIEGWARGLGVGKVLSVRMRREEKIVNGKALKNAGKFKGSVFVEFLDASGVEKFLALDPKPTFQDKPLEVMSKADYVEMKRQIHAPGTSKPAPGVPRAPGGQSGNQKGGVKPYNAWAQHLIDENGYPSEIEPEQARGSMDRKRKADDSGSDEREILFDGVRFTAKRTGKGDDATIEIVNEAEVGTGEGQWPAGKLLKFTVSKSDGSMSGDKERGSSFNVMELKSKITPIVKPGFIGLTQNERPIAGLPGSSMAVDAPVKSEFPTKLSAPPTIASASDASTSAPAAASSSEPLPRGVVEYPAAGQASFKEMVTDEILEKIKSQFGEFEGRKIEWTRATPEAERAHVLTRARWHAKEAFSDQQRGGQNGRGGGRGGRGGNRGGRGGGRGGNRGGRDGGKRQRRD